MNFTSFVVIIFLAFDIMLVFSNAFPLCNITSTNVNYTMYDCIDGNAQEIKLFEYRLGENDYFLDEEEEILYPDEYYYYDFFNEYDHENNSNV